MHVKTINKTSQICSTSCYWAHASSYLFWWNYVPSFYTLTLMVILMGCQPREFADSKLSRISVYSHKDELIHEVSQAELQVLQNVFEEAESVKTPQLFDNAYRLKFYGDTDTLDLWFYDHNTGIITRSKSPGTPRYRVNDRMMVNNALGI